MKKIFTILYVSFVLGGVMGLLMFPVACKKTSSPSGPVITNIRNYAASPNDTLVTDIKPAQWIVIHGQNLKNATQILFDGVPASFNYELFTNDMAVVQIPSSIPFNTVAADLLNTIKYVTTTGSTVFKFNFFYPKPTITGLKNETFFPGDSVYILGSGFILPSSVSFAGATITNYKTDSAGTSIGFVCPPLSQVPGGPITIVAKGGTITTAQSYTVGKPSILYISNENPSVGDSVYIYGSAFKNIQGVTFGGATIPAYTVAPDYSYIGFQYSSPAGPGPVTVTTLYGTVSTLFNVSDVSTGIIASFESGSGWEWWGGSNLYSGNPSSSWPSYIADFPDNTSHFQVLKTGILSAGEGNTWSSYAVRMDSTTWIPAANMNDPVANWAVKFEMSVPKAWNGGTIAIVTSKGDYVARYEPWQINSTATAPFTTNGWVTVTIPCTTFRASDPTLGDGKGASVGNFTKLLGASGGKEMIAYMHNYGTASTATGFYGAFDNFRVVRIK